jgi:hypothetical protein
MSERCICPSESGLHKQEMTLHGGGGVCYVCRPPPLCPSDGYCTGDDRCGCKEGFERVTHDLGGPCYACQ